MNKALQFMLTGGIRAASALMLFFLYMVVARTSSVEESGEFFYFHTIVCILGPTMLLGMQAPLVREFSRLGSASSRPALYYFFRKYIFTNLLSFPVALVVIGLVLLYTDRDIIYLIPIFFAALGVSFVIGVASLFQANGWFNISIISINFIGYFFFFFLLYVLGYEGDLIFGYSYAVVLSSVIVLLIFLFNSNRASNVEVPKSLSGRTYFSLVTFSTLLFNWSGLLVLGLFYSGEELAELGVAQRIGALVAFFLFVSNTMLAPKISKLYADNKISEIADVSLYSSRILILFSIPIILIVCFFSEYLLQLFGTGYDNVYSIILVVAIAQFINVIFGNCTILLSMTGGEKELAFSMSLGACIGVVTSFLLIPNYGALGAAYSFMISMVLMNLLCLYFVRFRLGFWLVFGFLIK